MKEKFYPLSRRLEEFYNAFEVQWNKENKQFGFEVQDYRLGGLIRRVEHTAKIIMEYVNGNIDCIQQLEEPLIEVLHNKDQIGDMHMFSNYITICT